MTDAQDKLPRPRPKVDELAELRVAAAYAARRPELIRSARAAGRRWEDIAPAAAMSRAGVIKLSHVRIESEN